MKIIHEFCPKNAIKIRASTPGVDAQNQERYDELDMSTPSRYFQEGGYYHVYNRGNRKQQIFFGRRDYERFMKKTEEYKTEFGITLLCYCLMPNHFHFLLRQDTEVPVTDFMLRLGTSYAKYINIKYDQVGSLFQDRFKAKLVETDEYLLELSRYIHRNPLVLQPFSTPGVALVGYKWSSYRFYLEGIKNNLIDSSIILNYFSKEQTTRDYKDFVEYDFREEKLFEIGHLLF